VTDLIKLSAEDLLKLGRESGAEGIRAEVLAELARRTSKAARAAHAELLAIEQGSSLWSPDLELAESFSSLDDVQSALNEIWGVAPLRNNFGHTLWLSVERQPKGWMLGFSSAFKKSVALADKNLQGRVMAALSDLVDAPIAPRGDTVKPLSNTYKGLWRYRLGDYRLIYEPRADSLLVLLVDLVARGGAYKDA
jgi:mRNA interferase RelE/StbE